MFNSVDVAIADPAKCHERHHRSREALPNFSGEAGAGTFQVKLALGPSKA